MENNLDQPPGTEAPPSGDASSSYFDLDSLFGSAGSEPSESTPPASAAASVFDDEGEPQGYAVPENDDDLQPYLAQQHQWAQELLDARTALRTQATAQAPPPDWEGVAALGSPTEIQQALDLFYGLYQPQMRDGQIVTDPQTGLPLYSAQAGLQALQQYSPRQVSQIFDDLALMDAPGGQAYLADFIQRRFGVSEADFVALVKGELQRPAPVIDETELEGLSAPDAELVKGMRAGTRQAFLVGTEEERADLLAEARERQQDKQQLAKIEQWRTEQETQAREAFAGEIRTATEGYLTELRANLLGEVLGNLTTKYQFSADEKSNTALQSFTRVVLQASLDPVLAGGLKEAFATLGIEFAPQYHAAVESAQAHAAQVKQLQAVAQNPRYQQYADPAALAAAERELQSSLRQIRSVMGGIAGQLAKVMGASAKGRSDAVSNQAQQRASRVQVHGVPAYGDTSRKATGDFSSIF